MISRELNTIMSIKLGVLKAVKGIQFYEATLETGIEDLENMSILNSNILASYSMVEEDLNRTEHD